MTSDQTTDQTARHRRAAIAAADAAETARTLVALTSNADDAAHGLARAAAAAAVATRVAADFQTSDAAYPETIAAADRTARRATLVAAETASSYLFAARIAHAFAADAERTAAYADRLNMATATRDAAMLAARTLGGLA